MQNEIIQIPILLEGIDKVLLSTYLEVNFIKHENLNFNYFYEL